MKRYAILALLAVSAISMGQTFGPGLGGGIPDSAGADVPAATSFTSDIVVTGSGVTVGSLANVQISGLTHTFVGDLVITLTHVDTNTTIDILDRRLRQTPNPGGSAASFNGGIYTFVAAGGTDVANSGVLGTGNYNADINVATGSSSANLPYTAFAGQSANGTWRLTITDWWSGDTGSLNSWNFTVTPVPEPCSMIIMGVGMAGVIARRRRGKRA